MHIYKHYLLLHRTEECKVYRALPPGGELLRAFIAQFYCISNIKAPDLQRPINI